MGFEDGLAPIAYGLSAPVAMGRHVQITALDVGWTVIVTNPQSSGPTELERLYGALPTIMASINMAGGKGLIQGMDEAMEPYKEEDGDRQKGIQAKLEAITNVVKGAMARPNPLRKPIEYYAFTDFAKMMAFVQDVLKP